MGVLKTDFYVSTYNTRIEKDTMDCKLGYTEKVGNVEFYRVSPAMLKIMSLVTYLEGVENHHEWLQICESYGSTIGVNFLAMRKNGEHASNMELAKQYLTPQQLSEWKDEWPSFGELESDDAGSKSLIFQQFSIDGNLLRYIFYEARRREVEDGPGNWIFHTDTWLGLLEMDVSF